MFRKFHDDHPSGAQTEEEEGASDDQRLLHQAGHEARRPLTRSSVKPKLLFQAEIKQKKLENGEFTEDEEEATTDMETPIATPSRGKGKMIMKIDDDLQEATPPPTTARKAKRGTTHFSVPSLPPHRSPAPEISFDSWTRVKSAHSSGGSSRGAAIKRSGSPLKREVDKKARSEHSSSSMSVDSV